MKTVYATEKKPIKLWLTDLEEGALKQAKNLANLPFTYKHVPIMPDSHQGYGMPIGSILATKGVVVPNAVGVDIGCGMCAVPTRLKGLTKSQLLDIVHGIQETVPVGFNKHKTARSEEFMPNLPWQELPVTSTQYEKALYQVGTLGGGNHFIELQEDEKGEVWVMIHSGSRNLGYTVAKYYNDIAKKENLKYHSSVTPEMELAFLPANSMYAQEYWKEMEYCVEFALANRRLMMLTVLDVMVQVCGDFESGEMINKSHNFAAWENHFGQNVIVHRKGATKAYKGELGMIPGSQGSSSYIVMGKGEEQSFKSCSHGAGRKMGRKQAQRELSLTREIDHLDKMGVIHTIRKVKDLDEAPSSYKDIDIVMENQTDLVDIVHKLTPLAVVKG